ncbi:MAG: TIM barrel protein [Sulfolobales archaeon]
MPRLGFSVWREDAKRISELVSKLIEAGYDHVEVSIESPMDLEDPGLSLIINTIRGAGLSIGFHAPWKEIYIASPVEEIRSAAVDVIAKVLRTILRFEPEYFVLHGSSEQNICSKNEDLCLAQLGKSMESLLKIYGNIYIETIQGICCGKISQILKLMEIYRELRACLDLAHIAVENMVKGKNKWPSRIADALNEIPESVGKRSPLIHLHGLKGGDKRVRTHYDFSYTPLGAEDIARAARLWGVKYIVFEVFYRSAGDPIEPSDLYEEIKKMRGWLSLLGGST